MAKPLVAILTALIVLVLLVKVVAIIGSNQFKKQVDKEIEELYQNVTNQHQVITETDLDELPPVVRNWLKFAGVVGKETIVTARTKQDVELRLAEEKPWMPATAEQYFRTANPGFIWKAYIKAAPMFHIAGRDKYIDGHGNMLIKIMSLKTIADAGGPEIDQGTLLRYLAETMWFPTAALSDYISWEPINSHSAKATMNINGVSASGVFSFNEQGEITHFEAERYGDFNGQYRLETWSVVIGDYREFEGFVIPSTGKIIWKLDTGDFEWYHFQVKEMVYNQL